MIMYADKPEEQKDQFEEYFESTIVPLIEQENKTKDKYRSKFWGYLFSVLFLMSANVLVVLFGALMHKNAISWGQIILINVVAFMLVFWPIYRYNKMPKNDIFDVFLKYYGNWKHSEKYNVKLVHSPIIPKHDAVMAKHEIHCDFGDMRIEMRDTYYTKKSLFKCWNKEHTISSGVILYVTFPQEFKGKLLMFEKGGFYRKSKFEGYELYNSRIDIPSANYFNIFVSDSEIGENLLHSLFFENVLDLKDVFKTRRIYVQAENNYMRVYLDGSEIYIDNYKLWNKKIDKNRFLQMHHEFENVYMFVQVVRSLMERKDDDRY